MNILQNLEKETLDMFLCYRSLFKMYVMILSVCSSLTLEMSLFLYICSVLFSSWKLKYILLFSRVRTDKNGGAWCPQKQATTEPEEWIQVDLKTVHMITATETQGRFGNGQGIEYAEAYMLEYWRPRLQTWMRYHNSKGEEVSIKITEEIK